MCFSVLFFRGPPPSDPVGGGAHTETSIGDGPAASADHSFMASCHLHRDASTVARRLLAARLPYQALKHKLLLLRQADRYSPGTPGTLDPSPTAAHSRKVEQRGRATSNWQSRKPELAKRSALSKRTRTLGHYHTEPY